MDHLTPLQLLGFQLFLSEKPNGIPYSEIGDYKQPTVGCMWSKHWIEYIRGRNLVRISRTGRERWEQEQEYLNTLTIKRAHPSDKLSMRIDVTAINKQRRAIEGGKRKSTATAINRSAAAASNGTQQPRSARGGLGYRGSAGHRLAAAG
jgi:hypothetical protein